MDWASVAANAITAVAALGGAFIASRSAAKHDTVKRREDRTEKRRAELLQAFLDICVAADSWRESVTLQHRAWVASIPPNNLMPPLPTIPSAAPLRSALTRGELLSQNASVRRIVQELRAACSELESLYEGAGESEIDAAAQRLDTCVGQLREAGKVELREWDLN